MLSFALDRIALPRAPMRRPLAPLLLHILSVIWVFNLLFAVARRPIFAAFVAAALVGLIAAVSNAKYESLREPFVFSDLSLFSQLFSHPRLYLPYLSVGKAISIVGGVVFMLAGFIAEQPVKSYSLLTALALSLIIFAVCRLIAARMPLTLTPSSDQATYGCFAVFIAYLLNGLRPGTFAAFRHVVATGPFVAPASRGGPDVIMIQSESFFDVRRISDAIDPSILSNFTRAQREAEYHGELVVPAWGANTMRTEFAVLTGVRPESLKYARFYPYAFVRRACASLASWFGKAGYDTVAIHPYYADFFGRNRAFPLLGFESFLDIEHFASARREGQYIADSAVADAIFGAIDAPGGRPRFIFAMTMENHGPLHLERVLPGESASWHSLGDGDSWHELTAYLRHIANADAMIGSMLERLRKRERETVVCFYGDHVPAMPTIFDQLGTLPETTDYFIWRNHGVVADHSKNISANALGSLLLHVVQGQRSRLENSCALQSAL
ncbi:LTA synthase family protein [Burkholderia multivorans]|uniref:LTA synthase family protein n=1 Tax=Burkholderia multivorans TaxID=87883 RepID=UPI000D00F64E|nr:LTA synthase family protein [Burkholderia multivorans]MBU9401232.1 LTA synthase family protein [Burkholderia multivorans]MCO1371946.1 LTA synthase family protein [Burkholderia multivorans]MCO1456803.1 LTA synthase family protein [Burkholderia multivorans]MCO1465793.1 LTA synthase family protein [Burkholderia multivorans]MDN8051595.1 LTA synthase family protein [Burkholderia multivorans]